MNDFSRYHRQMLLPGIGESGQDALAESAVLIAGCGALGTVAADLLARAGVGTLVVVDRDVVETTNLQRQTLFTERDAARAMPKAEAAKLRLAQVNSTIRVRGFVEDLAPDTIRELAADCDVLLDGLDNFETRYLLNDYAVSEDVDAHPSPGRGCTQGALDRGAAYAVSAMSLSRSASARVERDMRYRRGAGPGDHDRCGSPCHPGDQTAGRAIGCG